MSLLGYDPAVYHTGRAPLEAAAQQIPLSPTDWVFRCNLVTVVDGVMKDHSAGGISDAEAQRLHRATCARSLDLPGFEFHYGVSYRNLLVYRGHETVRRHDQAAARDSRRARSTSYLPRGKRQRAAAADHGPLARAVRDHEINADAPRDRPEPRDAGLALGPGPRAEHADVRRALRRRIAAA